MANELILDPDVAESLGECVPGEVYQLAVSATFVKDANGQKRFTVDEVTKEEAEPEAEPTEAPPKAMQAMMGGPYG